MMVVLYRLFLFGLAVLVAYFFCTRLASRQLTRILGLLGLAGIATALVFPEITNNVARVFGVGRGADFLFYLMHLFVLFAILVFYVRLRAVNQKLLRVVRELALREAETKARKP